ncbi:hypothetical protein N2152v2_010048 [Parachlorella kessleri]
MAWEFASNSDSVKPSSDSLRNSVTVASVSVFYDLLCSDSSSVQAPGHCQEWVEVVVKEGLYGSVQDVKDLRDSLKLGDAVVVRGRQESSHVVLAVHVDSVLCASESQTAPPPSVSIAAQPAERGPGVEVAQGYQPGVCKYWVNTGQENERRLLSSSQGFVHSASAAAKRCRAQVFAAWLVKTYRKEVLNAGAGVLDVAGGAGSVTFELAVVHGINCTLVDPRPLKLTKHHHRQLQQAGLAPVVHTLAQQQLQEQADRLGDLGWGGRQAGELDMAAITLDRQGTENDSRLVTAAGLGADGTPAAAADVPSLAVQNVQQQQGEERQRQQPAEVHLWQVQAWFGPQLWQSPGWKSLFGCSISSGGSCSSRSRQGYSLLVGLHPDQATEPILDLALQTRRPFAVVPCCVFARLFPHRRLPSSSGGTGEQEEGQPVFTYAQLLEYLTVKGQAQQCVLGFDGANTVVYCT